MSKAATDRGHLDLIDDLIDIDMGLYIIKLLGTEFEDIGIQLALHSGALLAESFSERVGSCVNNIMTEGRTLLGAGHLEKVTVLRMNKKYMEYKEKHSPQLAKKLLHAQKKAMAAEAAAAQAAAAAAAQGGGGGGSSSSSSGASDATAIEVDS